MKIIWGKPKRHRPNPKKVRWNRIRRIVSHLVRIITLLILLGGGLVAIIYF